MVKSKNSDSIFPGVLPPRTPGPLGFNDAADPSVRAYLGKTPGPMGFNDAWDPSLYMKGGNSIGRVIPPNCSLINSSTRIVKPWVSSDKLLPYLAIWENGVANGRNFAGQMVTNGFILTVYNDSRNKPTIGCGHLVVATDNLRVGDTITIDKANEILKKDLQDAEKAINDKINVPLYQYEYDALVSIAFNTGRQGVIKLTEFVNGGEYETIPDRIQQYRTGGGNELRRASEAKLFQLGVYNATH